MNERTIGTPLPNHYRLKGNVPQIVAEREAARYIGMSVAFLRQARCNGPTANRTPGPIFIKIGRAVRYCTSDLDAWLEEHRRSGDGSAR